MMQSLRMKYILALLLATNHTLYSAYGYLDDSGIEVDADADGVEDVGSNDSGKSESLKSYQCIYQSDFDNGTMLISEPGNYKLCEDISFYPLVNSPEEVGVAEAFTPIFDEGIDEHAFGMGYFAALCISASHVTIHLNGHTIQQSPEHALLQRFFAVIELSDSPFIKGTGPAQFVGESKTDLQASSKITILGPGIIGRSSHHGIHGNDNKNVVIQDVTFQDFEVAAVSMNNVNKVVIKRCQVPHNRHDVPVLGMFSAAKFISPYGKKLKELNYTMDIRGEQMNAFDVYSNLVDSMNNVYMDVKEYGYINKAEHPEEYDLFHNPHGVIDGPCYAFLVHGRGPAVGDFGFSISQNRTLISSKVAIKNNIIHHIKCWTNEVPAIVEENKVVNDARGAVFQLIRSSDNAPIAINDDGTYKGNVVADMQIMVAKAIHDNVLQNTPQLQTLVNSINPKIINWASTGTEIYTPKFRCNGDSMHHVNKGMTIIRVEDAVGFDIRRNIIGRVSNLSPPAFNDCFDYHGGVNLMNMEDKSSIQQGANIRGISVSAVTGYKNKSSTILGNRMRYFKSDEGNVIVGIDVQGECDSILIKWNKVNLAGHQKEVSDKRYISLRLSQYSNKDVLLMNNNFEDQPRGPRGTNRWKCPGQRRNEWPVGCVPGECPFGFN